MENEINETDNITYCCLAYNQMRTVPGTILALKSLTVATNGKECQTLITESDYFSIKTYPYVKVEQISLI